MRSINVKNYDQFSPLERLNLAIAALARNDETEIDRLNQSCPMYKYSVLDPEYTKRFLFFALISGRFFELCVYWYDKITFCAFGLILWASEGNKKDYPDKSQIILAQNNYISLLKGVYAGLRQFCDEVGLNADDIIKATPVENILDDISRYLLSDVEASAANTEYFKKDFFRYWKC